MSRRKNTIRFSSILFVARSRQALVTRIAPVCQDILEEGPWNMPDQEVLVYT